METFLIQVLLSAIAGLMGVLILLIGWIGNRIFQRMDAMQNLLRESESGLHERINEHEHRLTTVETHCKIVDRRKHPVGYVHES